MTRPGFAFSTTFRVRYAEIDGQMVVYNSRYLEYADVAVTEFWLWTGISAALGAEWDDADFHVRKTEIEYFKPFVFGDVVESNMRIDRVGTSSLTQYFELAHAETGALHCSISMVVVNVDLASGRPVPITPRMRDYLSALPKG